MPVMLFSSLFGSAITGFYGFTQRILNIPITFVAQSVADVFKQKVSEEHTRTGSCRIFFIKTIKGLTWIVVPFIIGFLLFAPSVFSIVFGKEWVVAGRFAQCLSVYYGLRFFSGATSYIFIVIKKQKYNLFIQIAMLVSVFGSIYIGYLRHDAFLAVLILGICGAVIYGISFVLLYWCSGLTSAEKKGLSKE
jgi:O-antigen/teichoic acid export membrane protein